MTTENTEPKEFIIELSSDNKNLKKTRKSIILKKLTNNLDFNKLDKFLNKIGGIDSEEYKNHLEHLKNNSELREKFIPLWKKILKINEKKEHQLQIRQNENMKSIKQRMSINKIHNSSKSNHLIE